MVKNKNDKENTLHGGFDGYHKKVWKGSLVKEENYVGVKFTRLSPDGEQGMPGNVKLEVYYLLDNNNNLTCYYTAKTDKATPINITNHAYFNLAGNGKILNHTLKMNSKYMLIHHKAYLSILQRYQPYYTNCIHLVYKNELLQYTMHHLQHNLHDLA